MLLESRVSRIRPTLGRFARPVESEASELADELNDMMRSIQAPEPAPAKGRTPPADDSSRLDAAIEMVIRAAQAMDAMEEHAQSIQAKAHELAERARHGVGAAKRQVASAQQRLSESEARAEELERRLTEAEERARTACERLARLQETINAAFASRRTPASAPKDNEVAPVAANG
jgi:chromosome segregation ATPase